MSPRAALWEKTVQRSSGRERERPWTWMIFRFGANGRSVRPPPLRSRFCYGSRRWVQCCCSCWRCAAYRSAAVAEVTVWVATASPTPTYAS